MVTNRRAETGILHSLPSDRTPSGLQGVWVASMFGVVNTTGHQKMWLILSKPYNEACALMDDEFEVIGDLGCYTEIASNSNRRDNLLTHSSLWLLPFSDVSDTRAVAIFSIYRKF